MSARARWWPLAVVSLTAACGDVPPTRSDALVQPRARPAPPWITSNDGDLYPEARFFTRVGAAELGASEQDARERAEARARGGLANDMSSRVRSSTWLHEVFEGDDEAIRMQVTMKQTVEVVGEGTLEGARAVDFFIDEPGRTAYCLLVLEREPAARELARRIEQLEADAAALLARSKTAAPGPALLALCDAHDQVIAARLLRVSYAVLAGGPLGRRDAVGGEVVSSLRAMTSGLALRVESGQGQNGRVGGQLSAPIVFQLCGPEGRGIDGVGLRFELRDKARAELSAPVVATVAGGAAALSVRALGASGQRSNQIECRVDALAKRQLQGPSVIAEYLLPMAADTRVLLATKLLVFGEEADASALQAGLLAALGTAGFASLAPSTLASELGADHVCDLTPFELGRRLRGKVEWVVRVHGSARDSDGRVERRRARSSADVELVDVTTGQIDRFTSDPMDGLGDTHAQAAQKSLEQLSTIVGSDIVERLKARVGI